jgi:hypothetical protein
MFLIFRTDRCFALIRQLAFLPDYICTKCCANVYSCGRGEANTHRSDFLLRQIFPRQAEVISSADLNGLLQ